MRAGDMPVHEYLVEEANLRGFLGASRPPTGRSPDPSLSLEEIVVGLLDPHAPAEARVFKLVLRMLQSGRLEPGRLHLLARRERAAPLLYWLLQITPNPERNAAVERLSAAFSKPPRGFRPPKYRYDPRRLIRRPATREELWKRPRRGS